jgi:hypothetical protein
MNASAETAAVALKPERNYVTPSAGRGRPYWARTTAFCPTASLIVGVAVASFERSQPLLTGVAGIVAGAMSMAAPACISQFPIRHGKGGH